MADTAPVAPLVAPPSTKPPLIAGWFALHASRNPSAAPGSATGSISCPRHTQSGPPCLGLPDDHNPPALPQLVFRPFRSTCTSRLLSPALISLPTQQTS